MCTEALVDDVEVQVKVKSMVILIGCALCAEGVMWKKELLLFVFVVCVSVYVCVLARS